MCFAAQPLYVCSILARLTSCMSYKPFRLFPACLCCDWVLVQKIGFRRRGAVRYRLRNMGLLKRERIENE